MRIVQLLPVFIALALGGIIALLGAYLAVNAIESRSNADVARAMEMNGYGWTQVDTDGLQVILSGFAPDEATRFRAIGVAGSVVDASRVRDMMNVEDAAIIQPPRFSIEILRNDSGISLIGLIPASMDRDSTVKSIQALAGGAQVTDLLDVADYPEPEGWASALSYGLAALKKLPRSKISIAADGVELIAISDSAEAKRRLETDLSRRAPKGLRVVIQISSPRPVITPYTLRFIIDGDGARFDACSTYTMAGQKTILAAARNAGLLGKGSCTIGLGVPSPTWDDAVVAAINKLGELGGGSVTFSDTDVTLIAPETTEQGVFDTMVGDLKAALPPAFSLHAVLPEPVVIDGTGEGQGPPEFIATKSPEGDVRLKGRIPNERTRRATKSFAQSMFSNSTVTDALRLDEELPRGWPARILASLEALAQLNSGSVVTQPDVVEIRGVTGNQDARAEIARILSEKLGASQDFRISVTYEAKLDPLANIPTPKECVAQINQVLSVQQITFAPSSADIDAVARASIDNIAEIMKKCQDVPMEVGGHTDSQGRESMNQGLSQARAEAVVNALLARRVLTSNLTSTGYGESQPLASNDTEAGREANRRIEFKLLNSDTDTAATPADDTPADGAEVNAEVNAETGATTDTQNAGDSDEQN